MTVSEGPPAAPAAAAPRLSRASGLQLVGEMRDSGYRVPPALVRRPDGQTVQLTAVLYAVLEEIRDGRTPDQVAEAVTGRLGRTVTAENVLTLAETRLRPLGLLANPDGSEPVVARRSPLLALRWKVAVTDTRLTRRIAAPFTCLFNPLLVVAVTAVFVAAAWWVLLEKGLASATYDAFQRPGLLLVILAVMVVSAGFHEFGHAAAARRGGADPGGMGVGLYLVWPAFYTDVTDSYRLGRRGRLRTDLGGLYFDALVAVAVFGVWALTRWDAWLLVVATQILGMVRQLAPLVRFDGYHILCDLTGVPDLFGRIKPVLLSFLPRYRRSSEVRALKPWVRVVVTVWVLAVIPLLLCALAAVVLGFPRLAGTAWAQIQAHSGALADAAGRAQWLDAGGRLVALVATGLPVLAIGLLLARLAYSSGRRGWSATAGRPLRRALAVLAALAVVAVVAIAWWPDAERYRPVRPWERGTLVDAVPTAVTRAGGPDVGYLGRAYLRYPAGATMPTADRPQLAMVLIPTGGTHADQGDAGQGSESPTRPGADTTEPGSPTDGAGSTGGQTWVFPFDRPLEPEPGDTQALAVNTTDGGTTYDVAFAMVWVDGSSQVDNRNEAWALASCEGCTTVAVAFQVVYVVGRADVVVPQNVAVAVNYNCLSCVTAALAQQLVLTLDRMPGEDAITAIQELWAGLMEFAQEIRQHPFSEIEQTLDDFEVAVLQVLAEDGALQVPGTSSPPASAGPSASPSDPGGTPSTTPGEGAATQPAAGPTDSPTPADGSSVAPTTGPTSGGEVTQPSDGATATSPGEASTSAEPAAPSSATGGSTGSDVGTATPAS